ncbi:MAG: hypothetical protein R3E96_07145 [Planctomycetota bacterium]
MRKTHAMELEDVHLRRPARWALRAFDAALRYLSFTHAAEELAARRGGHAAMAHLERPAGADPVSPPAPAAEVTPEAPIRGAGLAMLDRLPPR